MSLSGQGLGRLFVSLVLLIIASACTVTVNESPPEPSTPQITEGAENPELREALLTAQDFESVPSAPPGLVEQEVRDASLFENPDPRGPCGTPIEQPAFDQAVIHTFATSESPRLSLFHAVWELPPGVAQEFVDATQRDVRPGCPEYTSTTPTGKQRVTFLEEITLEGVGEAGVATSVRLDIEGAPGALYAAGSVLYSENRLSYFGVFSENPVPASFVREATALVAKEL